MADNTPAARPTLLPPREANPFSAGEIAVNASGNRGIVAVEQQKAIAEIQARLIVARANPRDPIRSMELILNDCTRTSLANNAVYQYARGGTDIRGPSIRLAEAIAQRWGNIASGLKVMSRSGEYSECVAYAWDLESGYYDERQFPVRHWRDTRQGGYQLTDERDIYELIANMGQRRKRAVLLTVIPGDVTEAALEQCERTMHAAADVTPDGIKKLVEAFAEMGVTQPQIEARIQRRLDAVRPAQIVMLRKVFMSLKDGMSEVADWFEAVVSQPTGEGDAPSGQQQQQQGTRRRTRRTRDADPPPPLATPATEDNKPAPTTEDNKPPPEEGRQQQQQPSGRRQVQFEV
jgi:hypothetical protein